MHLHLLRCAEVFRELLTRLAGSLLRSNDREETRKSMVKIARLPHADLVPDALLAHLPERECLLDGSLTGLCEQHDPGARVGRIPGDPEEAGLLQGQQVPRERG